MVAHLSKHKNGLYQQLVCCLSYLVVMFSSQVYASGGVFNPPHGALPMGWAGAITAGDATLHGSWYNPALIAGLPSNSGLFELTLVHATQDFTKSPRLLSNGEINTYPTVENTAPPSIVPQFGFVSGFGLKKWRFSIHGFAPQGVSAQYPLYGPQRYQLVTNLGSLMWMNSLGVSYRLSSHLWLGASLVNTVASFRQVITTSGYPGFLGAPENEDFDALVETNGYTLFNPTGQFGLRLMWGSLSFGASIWLPTTINVNPLVLKLKLPKHPIFDGAYIVGNQADVSFTLPMIARGGVRWSERQWAIEVDTVFEQHSTLSEMTTTPDNISVRNVLGSLTFDIQGLTIPKRMKDTWSIRVGGEWRTQKYLLLSESMTAQTSPSKDVVSLDSWVPYAYRAGVLFEQSAVPNETLNLAQIDAEKWGVCLGASWRLGDKRIDFGYSLLLLKDRLVKQSFLKQINTINAEGATMVAVGAYRSTLNMLSLAVGFNAFP